MVTALFAVSGVGSVANTPDTAYGQFVTNADTVKQVATSTPIDTETAVREYFKDIPVLVDVARCESSFRQTLADGTILRGKVDSRDIGVMQINTFYHGTEAAKLGLDLTKIEDNMKFARILYENEGTKPWSSSSACWSRSLASL